jgi:hypothetical protein
VVVRKMNSDGPLRGVDSYLIGAYKAFFSFEAVPETCVLVQSAEMLVVLGRVLMSALISDGVARGLNEAARALDRLYLIGNN